MNGNVLMDLEKRSNILKSKLLHEQLKHGNYSFEHYRKYFWLVLNDYVKSKSLFKASQNVGIDYNVVMSWFFQGQCDNPNFKRFYMAVNKVNQNLEVENISKQPEILSEDNISKKPEPTLDCKADELPDEEYVISEYGDGFSYKTYIDGEKIFLIADDLESLKKKVKSKHLPLS